MTTVFMCLQSGKSTIYIHTQRVINVCIYMYMCTYMYVLFSIEGERDRERERQRERESVREIGRENEREREREIEIRDGPPTKTSNRVGCLGFQV